jgi:cytidylate kinase
MVGVPVITVSRQFGSLGDEIAQDVADRLGLRLVNQDIINEVAQRLGVPASTVDERDEREAGLVSELVRTMRRLYPATLAPQTGPERPDVDEAAYLQVIRQVIWEVARVDNAVIVGRGGPFVLEKGPDTLHVLLVAPLEVRIERVMAREDLDHARATQRVRTVDANRARYIRHYYRANWLDVGHYDIVLNTGHFSPLRCVALICEAVSREEPTLSESPVPPSDSSH